MPAPSLTSLQHRLGTRVALGGLAVILLLLLIQLMLPRSQLEKPELMPSAPVLPKDEPAPTTPVRPRRLPIAGAEGYFVVIHPDGTSFLETPDNQMQPLVDAATARMPIDRDLEARLRLRLNEIIRPKRSGLGQLIVLEHGVVDVPQDAVITYQGKDRLVVLNGDGTSTVYHADGKVETRERQLPKERAPVSPSR